MDSRSEQRRDFLRVLLVVGLAIAAIVVLVTVLKGGDDDGSPGEQKVDVEAQLLDATPEKLRDLASEQGHEVYWAGEQPGVRYEWTRTSDGRVYVRYLKGNVKIGERGKAFLTVATYSFKNALTSLKGQASKAPGAESTTLENGAFVFYNKAGAPNSAYIAFPDSDYEAEIFDPSPGKAFDVAKSGKIEPIE